MGFKGIVTEYELGIASGMCMISPLCNKASMII